MLVLGRKAQRGRKARQETPRRKQLCEGRRERRRWRRGRRRRVRTLRAGRRKSGNDLHPRRRTLSRTRRTLLGGFRSGRRGSTASRLKRGASKRPLHSARQAHASQAAGRTRFSSCQSGSAPQGVRLRMPTPTSSKLPRPTYRLLGKRSRRGSRTGLASSGGTVSSRTTSTCFSQRRISTLCSGFLSLSDEGVKQIASSTDREKH